MATKQSRKREPKLPDKLSDCLAVALGDFIKCERQKRTYRIDMMAWHRPNSHCSVCLAGAVMAQSFGTPKDEGAWPDLFDAHNKFRLNAISNCAMDNLASGVSFFGGWSATTPNSWWDSTPRYSENPTAFKSTIRRYIKELRKHGL